MRKIILSLLLFVSTTITFAQSLDGVSISGDLETAVSKFKQKGYTFYKYITHGAIMKGVMNYQEVELFIYLTPKSKKIFKMVLYFPTENTWRSLSDSYDHLLGVLKNKYGTPDNSYSYFTTPYYLGDGYELQAVEAEKCGYSAYWFKRSNLTLAIDISQFKQVRISYENDTLVELKDKEEAELQRDQF